MENSSREETVRRDETLHIFWQNLLVDWMWNVRRVKRLEEFSSDSWTNRVMHLFLKQLSSTWSLPNPWHTIYFCLCQQGKST